MRESYVDPLPAHVHYKGALSIACGNRFFLSFETSRDSILQTVSRLESTVLHAWVSETSGRRLAVCCALAAATCRSEKVTIVGAFSKYFLGRFSLPVPHPDINTRCHASAIVRL